MLKYIYLFLVFICFGVSGVSNAADTFVSGTVSLPAGVAVYDEDKNFSVYFETNWNGNYFENSQYCGSFMLSAYQTSTTYNCTSPGITGEFGVRVSAWNITGIYSETYYNSEGSAWEAENAELLLAEVSHVNKNITLQAGSTFTGKIQMPSGEVFAEDKIIYVNWYYWYADSAYGYSYWRGHGSYHSLLQGSSEVEYSLTVPARLDTIKIGYQFAESPEADFMSEGYYSGNTTAYAENDASELNATLSMNDVNMNFIKGVPLNGTVSFPMGETNTQDVAINVNISGDNIYESQEVTIPAGNSFTDFTFSLPPGEQVRVRYNLQSETDNTYFETGYYSSDGTVDDYYYAELISTSYPPGDIDLHLLPGVKVSGKLSFPDELTYLEEVECELSISTDSGDDLSWEWMTIEPGMSEVEWSVVIPYGQNRVVAEVWMYRWSYDPDPEYLDNTYYNSTGMVGLLENAEILDASADLEDIDIVFLKGNIVSGTISLDSPDTFPAGTNFRVDAFWGEDYWDEAVRTYIDIDETVNNFMYALAVPPDAPGYKLRFNQWSGHPSYLSKSYYSTDPSGGYCESDGDVFISGNDYSETNFTLPQAFTVKGSVLLPNGDTTPENLPIFLGAISDPEGEQASTVLPYYNTMVEVPAESNSVTYELPLPVSCEDTPQEYYIGYRQTSSDYVQLGYYKDNSETVGLMSNGSRLVEGENYDPINIEIIRGNEISGTISVADGSSVPESGLPVMLGTLQDPVGVYHTTVTIEPLTTSVDYSIRVAPDVGDTVLGYTLPEYLPFASKGYYSGPTNLNSVSGIFDLAENMDPSISHDSKSFTLAIGNEVSGTIYGPGNTDDSSYYIEVKLAADPDDPNTVYWDTVMRVLPGTAVPYSTQVILDSPAYLQFTNSDNPAWLPLGYYFDNSSSVETMVETSPLEAEEDHLEANLFLGSSSTKGDVNFDGSVDLMDAILSLQSITGNDSAVNFSPAADVNGDSVLGLPEVIYILNQQ